MAHRGDCTPLSEPASDSLTVLAARKTFAALFQSPRFARLSWIVIQVIVQTIHNHHSASAGCSGEGPHHSKQRRPPRFRRWRHFALVGAVAALQFFRYADHVPAEYFSSEVDHPLHVPLDDGSELDLKGDSAVALQRTEAGPRFLVTRGEALFTIVHNASRHVDVLAGNALIRVLGTQFDVSVQHEKASVVVIDGSVMATRLSRNDIISVADGKHDGEKVGVRLPTSESTEISRESSQPLITQPVGMEEIRAMVSWNVRSFAEADL